MKIVTLSSFVFSTQKFILQIFAIIDDTSVMNFGKNLQYDFSENEGGGSKAFWSFSENSSVLVLRGFPIQGVILFPYFTT